MSDNKNNKTIDTTIDTKNPLDFNKKKYKKHPSISHITLGIMCKNEEYNILRTLESTLGTVKSIHIYDTGSDDQTVPVIEKYCNMYDITLYLKRGKFVDFSTSRNELLKFIEEHEECDYCLLMDANDVLKEGQYLVQDADQYLKDKNKEGFLMKQEWWSGELNAYFNVRFIRNKCGWKYKEPVHEYISKSDNDMLTRINSKCVLFQDRTIDDDKSSIRHTRDKKILLDNLKMYPDHDRTLFYLAQTCSCLGQYEEGYKWYMERTKINGFYEERFHAYLRAGILCKNNLDKKEQAIMHLMSALDMMDRVEPLIAIGEIYLDKKNWRLAYMFFKQALNCKYPEHCILFIDKQCYDYKRYHLMGIVAFYLEKFDEGYNSVCIAVQQPSSHPVDISNMSFYEEKLFKRILTDNERKQKLYETKTQNIDENKKNYLSKKLAIKIGKKRYNRQKH
jgi:hypothetical protein